MCGSPLARALGPMLGHGLRACSDAREINQLYLGVLRLCTFAPLRLCDFAPLCLSSAQLCLCAYAPLGNLVSVGIMVPLLSPLAPLQFVLVCALLALSTPSPFGSAVSVCDFLRSPSPPPSCLHTYIPSRRRFGRGGRGGGLLQVGEGKGFLGQRVRHDAG